jgi:acetylornithine deacetylase
VAVKLLERLVSFPTVAGESNEALVEYLVGWFEDRGARVTVVPSRYRPDGLNMYAVIGPPSDGGLLLAAHTDVVAVEGQPWSSDPFSLRRSGDHLYGRGTADMKGLIAAVLSVVAGINGRRLRRPLQIALSCDEELGCKGVPPLLEAPRLRGSTPSPTPRG